MYYQVEGKKGIWKKISEVNGKCVMKIKGGECVHTCDKGKLIPLARRIK